MKFYSKSCLLLFTLGILAPNAANAYPPMLLAKLFVQRVLPCPWIKGGAAFNALAFSFLYDDYKKYSNTTSFAAYCRQMIGDGKFAQRTSTRAKVMGQIARSVIVLTTAADAWLAYFFLYEVPHTVHCKTPGCSTPSWSAPHCKHHRCQGSDDLGEGWVLGTFGLEKTPHVLKHCREDRCSGSLYCETCLRKEQISAAITNVITAHQSTNTN